MHNNLGWKCLRKKQHHGDYASQFVVHRYIKLIWKLYWMAIVNPCCPLNTPLAVLLLSFHGLAGVLNAHHTVLSLDSNL